MIDLKKLRDAPEPCTTAWARRDTSLPEALEGILRLDAERRGLLQEAETLKADRNTRSEKVAKLIRVSAVDGVRAADQSSAADQSEDARRKAETDASSLVKELQIVSGRIKELDQQLRAVDDRLTDAMLRVPNLPLDDVPVGDASANSVVKTWSDPITFDFEARPHWDLGERLRLFDLPRGAKITGSGFPVYTGRGARLVRALVNFMVDLHVAEHDYVEMWPPALINADSARGTGQLPDLDRQMYLTNDELYLVPTAEVPITNLHRDEIFAHDDLPRAYVAYSPCFRREAGAHGKDTRGITRVHQFDKVELVRFCRPEDSPTEHEQLRGHAETVLQRLGLPYRVVTLATGDLGFASAKTYDLEVWAAGVGAWLEVSSASTFTDFQARRANIRYRPAGGGKPQFVHTLNASGLALPRTIIALLENNQQADGTVTVPPVLVPHVGTEVFTPDVG